MGDFHAVAAVVNADGTGGASSAAEVQAAAARFHFLATPSASGGSPGFAFAAPADAVRPGTAPLGGGAAGFRFAPPAVPGAGSLVPGATQSGAAAPQPSAAPSRSVAARRPRGVIGL